MPLVDPWIGPRGSAARRLLAIMREHGPLTRPEAARLTGMSVSGIRPLVAGLIADGQLIEQDAPVEGRSRGRPGTVLVATVPDGIVLGLDFGHAHVAVAVADLAGRQLGWESFEVDVDHRADEALDKAAELAESGLRRAGHRRGAGVGGGARGPRAGDPRGPAPAGPPRAGWGGPPRPP